MPLKLYKCPQAKKSLCLEDWKHFSKAKHSGKNWGSVWDDTRYGSRDSIT